MNHELDRELYLEMKRQENLEKTTKFQKGKKCISCWVAKEDWERYSKMAQPIGLATLLRMLLDRYEKGQIEIKL